MSRFLSILFHWLPVAIAATGVCTVAFVMVQQDIRSTMNDPQIELVRDASARLAAGALPVDIVTDKDGVDVAKSLSPFVAIYDKDGGLILSSGTVNGEEPKPALGVFQHAKKEGENRVTWQPDDTTRIALVVRPVPDDSGRFVASGRNMHEGEDRIKTISMLAIFGLIATLVGSFIFEIIGDAQRRAMMAKMQKP